eukprot:jgi/Bigna1/134069/aug1.23_g8777
MLAYISWALAVTAQDQSSYPPPSKTEVVHLLASSNSNGTDTAHHGGHSEVEGLGVMFLVFSLLAGSCVYTIIERFNIPLPYTVCMLVLGMAIGASNVNGGSGSNWFHQGMEIYASIDPHLLLQLFLPALIFESAFSSSYHIIKREFAQALLLAGPGVVISMILSCLAARYCFDYNWDWTTALLFGAILSATDPVAVVALLRDLGVSKRLATLIEGESLFNDGTAFVFFLVWIEFLEGNELSPGEIAVELVRLALGGFCFGLACAIPALMWLQMVFDNPAIETTITFGSAYICFWFAESAQPGIHVSGVLAIVALGLAMNRFKFFISVESEETVHHFWEMIGFVANTLIFFISGIVVVQRMFGDNENIKLGRDFGYLIMIYVLIHVIRGTTIFLLSPIMARLGYGFDWRIGTVLCYGGLRGAVGLALALIVDLNRSIDDEISDLILFHTAGIVTLTLLINGSTTGIVLEWVGLKKIKGSKLRAYHKAIESIKKQSEKQSFQMRKEKMFQMADWGEVGRYLPQYEHQTRDLALAKVKEIPFHLSDAEIAVVLKQQQRSYKRKTRLFGQDHDHKHQPSHTDEKVLSLDRDTSSQLDPEDLKQELIHRLLTAMQASFLSAYEEGQVSREAIPILTEAVETALDEDNLDVLWNTIDGYFCVTSLVWFTRCWPWLADRIYQAHYVLAVDLAVSFIHALQVIDKTELFHELANNIVYDELKEHAKQLKEKAFARWDSVEMDFPNLYYSLQTLFAIRRLLETERRAIDNLQHKGLIDENEKKKLHEALGRQSHWIMYNNIEPAKDHITSSDIITQIEFWDMTPKELQRKLQSCRRIALSKGQTVTHKHIHCRLYYVMQGILKVYDTKENGGKLLHTIGIGDMYGTWSTLNHQPK